MHFAITLSLLIVCGIVNAVHHDDIKGLPEFNRMKSKRSVFSGMPYPYGYNMPIEPLERKFDSYVDPYQSVGYWPYQQNSIQHWEIPATFPEPAAVNPENRVHEYLVSAPRSDVVYRTLMQRAAAAAASTAADVPDRGGNVAIQLTANLVYGYQPSGYRPSDVDEPVVAFPKIVSSSKFVGPFFDNSLQKTVMVPKNSADIEPAVIIVALSSSDSSEIKDAIAKDVDEYDKLLTFYHTLNQIDSSSDHGETSFAPATTTTEDPFKVINKFMRQILAESETSDRLATTTTEVNPAENEIGATFYAESTTATADSELKRKTACDYKDENDECTETEIRVELSDENESDDDTEDVLPSTTESEAVTMDTLFEIVDDENDNVEWSVTTEDPTTTTQAEEDENKEENDSDDDIDIKVPTTLDFQSITITENAPETTSNALTMEETESWNTLHTTEIEPNVISDVVFGWDDGDE